MNNSRTLVMIVACFLCAKTFAYQTPNHFTMSSYAVRYSRLNTAELQIRLGLTDIDDPNQMFPLSPADNEEADDPSVPTGCLHGFLKDLRETVACGAVFEDAPGVRSLNHFYDEQNGGAPLSFAGFVLGQPSPDWILGDGPDGNNPLQMYSYWNAQKYYFLALTSTNEDDRKKYWGLTFQSIGQVIHHIEDMAQPQHVRNDAHCDDPACKYVNTPSGYEYWGAANPGVIENAAQSSPGPIFFTHSPSFALPRDFWDSNDGVSGMARYTSTNFVSRGSNFAILRSQPAANSDEPLPIPTLSTAVVEDIAQVYRDLNWTEPPGLQSFCVAGGCNVTFVSTTAGKQYASTLSIFDADIQLQNSPVNYIGFRGPYQTDRVFTLNAINYEVAAADLVPKAVSYAAGMINYFFRGALTLAAPKSGVFGALDLSNSSCSSGQCGFNKLEINLQNGNLDEPTGSGTLTAIARYRRNSCFKVDFSGQYGVNAANLSCRSSQEFTSTSSAVTYTIGSSAQDYSFDFSQSPIPVNATDLYIQVVYQGPVGAEQNGIALGQLDISEPTPIDIENNLDYRITVTGCSPLIATIAADPGNDTPANFSVTFNTPNAPVIQGTVAAGEHAMAAVLISTDGVNMAMTSNYPGVPSSMSSADMEQADSTGVMQSSTYRHVRGSWEISSGPSVFNFEDDEYIPSSCNLNSYDYAYLYPAFTTDLKPLLITQQN